MRSGRAVGALLAAGLVSACGADRGDPDYDTSVAEPAYEDEHPALAFDEGHRELHASDGTYFPLAELARHDGYEVDAIDDPLSEKELAGIRVLVIGCARGANETGDGAAFSPEECTAVERWVDGGGGLLLVTDAFPCGAAASTLAAKFGVATSNGLTADAIQYDRDGSDDTCLDFSRTNRLLGAHPITKGRSGRERLERVVTFTGQSVRGGEGSVLFLRHGATAVLREARARLDAGGAQVIVQYGEEKPGEGWGQGLALVHGQGRVVVLGESSVLTALIVQEKQVGMNARGNDDRQLALNVLHWLSGLLPRS